MQRFYSGHMSRNQQKSFTALATAHKMNGWKEVEVIGEMFSVLSVDQILERARPWALTLKVTTCSY